MSEEHLPPKKRLDKPAGILILCGFDILVVGIVPVVLELMSFGEAATLQQKLGLAVLAVLCGMVILSAIMTMRGDGIGRIVLLVSVTLTCGLLMLSALVLLVTAEEGTDMARVVGTTIRSVFWLAANWWYFNKRNVVDYFRQEDES